MSKPPNIQNLKIYLRNRGRQLALDDTGSRLKVVVVDEPRDRIARIVEGTK